MFNIVILTLYPEVFPGYLDISNAKKSRDRGIWNLEVINIRDFALDRYKKVDDKVFGGGKGLLIKADVLGRAIDYSLQKYPDNKLIYPNPRGAVFKQSDAQKLSEVSGITFICGHFEGIDERIIDKYNPLEISIGDYILSGGEMSSMVIADSILRLLPNVVNSSESVIEESFKDGLLEYPQYTKPRYWQNFKVPEVLLSGNHKTISEWRLLQSEKKTKEIRPDLWKIYKEKTE